MTNKKFKLAAMSLATAVAVSAVGPSASAVTYYLGDGSVTVGQDENRGAFSYQGEDRGDENRTYVNVEKAETGDGTIYVKGGNAPTGDVTPPTDNSGNGTEETTTGNTITVKEDVKEETTSTDHTTDSSADNTENSSTAEIPTGNTITVKEDVKDATIVVDRVNVDTSTQTEAAPDTGNTGDKKTIIKVGEGANVDLTVRDSNLTTGGNGIDIGVNLKDKDDNKETKVDLTLDNTDINLTEKANTAGIVARDHSTVNVTLKGENPIDGKEALEDAAKEAEEAKKEGKSSPNRNVEGIRVGGEGAGDGSGTSEGAKTHLTISGGVEKTETADADTEETESPAGGSLTISETTGGLVMADGSNVEITDGADVTIEDTKTSSSTQAGRAVTQHGDLTLSGGSSLTIDGGKDNKAPHTGIGIASWDDIIVKAKSTLNIKNIQTGIYGHQGASTSLTTEDSTLNITNSDAGIRYEGSGTAKDGSKLEAAGDITFKDSDVTIEGKSLGIETGNNSNTTVTFDHTTAAVSAELTKEENVGRYAIYCEDSGENGSLIVKNGSKLEL